MEKSFDLAYWINERESMRIRREQGIKAPWSYDPHMAKVRYCNVHREDDKVTRYLRSSPVFSGVDVPLWVTVLTRMVNRIETLEELKDLPMRDNHILDKVRAKLKERREQGLAIWGNAYTISTCGKSMDKVDYVLDWVVQAVADAGDPEFDTLQGVWKQITCIDGLGSFLAAQVVADLKNTPGHALTTASDWFTWCAPGPGSLAGLTAYYGQPITPRTFYISIDKCYKEVQPLIADYVGPVHMQDFQNCLCEFSKYERVRAGGRARNTYDARN
jgi:hypothetical protein